MKYTLIFALCASLFISCNKEETSISELRVNDVTMDENPAQDSLISQITFNTLDLDAGGVIEIRFVNDNTGGLRIEEDNNGTFYLYIDDPTVFDFESANYPSTGFQYEIESTVENDGEITDTDNASFRVFLNDVDESGGEPILSVQQRLDDQESPFEIYNSDNTLLDSLYGKSYAGGLIFYMDISNGSGLVARVSDLSESLPWDYNDFTNLSATGATSQTVADGSANTTTIIDLVGTGGDYAAKNCRELPDFGSNDWFLPTSGSLDLMYTNLHANGMGSFSDEKYWSSSEFDATGAWTRDFSVSSGQTATSVTKVNTHKVRPVRAF